MTLLELKELLKTVNVPVYHYFASKQEGNYIVWAEDGEVSAEHADDQKIGQTIQGTIDYFTRDEFDPVFAQIQQTLNSGDLSWRLNSIQYEENTKYIHYEWLFEVVNDFG